MTTRIATVLAVATAALTLSASAPPAAVPSGALQAKNGEAEVLWDRWGVPHIFASDLPSAMYAYGWAQMHNHGDLMLRLYGQARGRAAEYWGAPFADTDRWVKTMGVPARAARWVDQQPAESRAAIEAFVAGVNAYATQHADRLANEFEVVLPITPTDVIAHLQRVIHFAFVANPQSLDAQMRRWAEAGSNAWAVSPKRTAEGRALLLANPHLPWTDFFTWFEAQITAPGISVYGATLVGGVFPAIAFNDRLGWTHTNNTIDAADLYELQLVEGDAYRWESGSRKFEIRTELLKVRQPDGRVVEEPMTVRESVHGPVIRAARGRALALRVAGLDQPNMLGQYLNMIRARSLAEFERAQQPLQMPFFTVMYADRDGRIMHLFGGRTPVRPAGQYDWRGIVPGVSESTLWTATHPYAELPRIVDPPSGWLQNANDPPWTTTFPVAIDADAFPRYMAPRAMSLRAQNSADLLGSDPKLTFESFIARKHSTRVMLAERVLKDLIAAARAAGGPAAAAADVLAAWDGNTDAGSRGAVLFEAWYRRHARSGNIFATRWSESEPRTTPRGLASPEAAVAALVEAGDAVRKQHGAMDVAWGDVYRLRLGRIDLPANGGPDELGVFRLVGYSEDKDGKWRAVGGESYVAAVEFGPAIRARSLISYGNASQPGSAHAGDQLELFARKALKPVWLTKAEIEKNLERREIVRR